MGLVLGEDQMVVGRDKQEDESRESAMPSVDAVDRVLGAGRIKEGFLKEAGVEEERHLNW